MGSIFSVADLFDMLRRRMFVILGLAALGTMLSVLFALSQQHLYMSTEVLQLQTPKITSQLAPSTVTESSARRIQRIQHQVMSRAAILEIIQKLGLSADMPGLSKSEQVTAVRQSVYIEGVAAVQENRSDDGAISLLRVNATWTSAVKAQALAREFSEQTTARSTSNRLDHTGETLEFFTRRDQALRQQLTHLQEEAAEFRNNTQLARPDDATLARREIENLNEQILNIDRNALQLERQVAAAQGTSRVEQRQRESSQNALNGLIDERSLLQGRLDRLLASLENTTDSNLQLVDFDRQIAQLRDQLETVSAHRKEAEIGHQLEVQQQSEHLVVLEPAVLPEYPITRARKHLVLFGAFASLCLGCVVAFLLDWRRPVLRSAVHMEHYTGLRPVVSIPEIRPKIELKRQR